MANKPNLVIVESPSKAKTIGKYLGPGYTVKASMGHLRDLPKSTMGVDLEQNFEPKAAAKMMPDGTMVSVPLEDLAPFLSDEELAENMIIPMIKN